MSFATNPNDIFQSLGPVMAQQFKPQPIELVKCAKCSKMYNWSNIRKLLDDQGEFVEYRCSDCVTEGYMLT